MSLIELLTATEKQMVSGRLHMRPIQWHLKKHWHVPEALKKLIPLPKSLHAHLRWWLDPNKVLKGQPLHPLCHALQLFTDTSNEGWGAHCKRPLVQVRRRLAHKPSRAQSGFVGPETVRAFVLGSDHPGLHRQHNSGFLQGGRYEIRLCLCPPLETPVMVQQETNSVTGQTHSESPKSHCRQTVQTQTGDSDRVVSPAGGFRPTLPEVAHTGSGLIRNQIQSQTSQVCVTGSGPFGLESRCFESSVGGSGCLCLSSSSNSGTSGHQTVGPKVSQNDPDCAGMAQHDMVLGPGQHVSSNSPLPAKGGEFINSTIHFITLIHLT